MDNASKALIMAGAILLAVAIVGLGVYFFSMSEGLTQQSEESILNLSTELQNSELLKYEGDRVKGSDVRSLARKVQLINNTGDWPETISGVDAPTAYNNNKLYNVTMTPGSTGYIQTITITQVGS